MKKMLSICVVCSIFVFTSIASEKNEENSAFFKDFEHLLVLCGAEQTQRVMIKQMFGQFKAMAPNNPAFANMEKTMDQELKALNKKMFPIYKKYLSHEDIKALIKVFNSPAAKKFVSVQPNIVKESMKIGMEWGQDVAKRVMSQK